MPFAGLLPCLLLGLSATPLLTQYNFASLALANVLLLWAAWLALRRNRLPLSLVSSLASTILCGCLLGLADRDSYSPSSIRSLLERGAVPLDETVFFDGCLAEETERRDEEILLTIELHGFRAKEAWIACEGRALLRMPAGTTEETPVFGEAPRYGDRLHGWADWSVPRNFANPGSGDRAGFLARRGIFLAGRIKSARLLEVLPRDCAHPWRLQMVALRGRIRTNLSSLVSRGASREAAILASLLIGDYTGLDSATREAFQSAGTYHVLVVSGLHVGWISWTLMHAFRLLRFSSRTSSLLVAGGILCYASLIGFQASITRCLWVYILYITGQALYRGASPTNLLLATGFVLLVTRPKWLFDAGFQLSFLSVLAILLLGTRFLNHSLYPLLRPLRHAGKPEMLFLEQGKWHSRGRRLRIQAEVLSEGSADKWRASLARPLLAGFRLIGCIGLHSGSLTLISLAVQIFLGLLMAFYFNRLSWVSPAANLVVVPLSSLVLGAGILSQLASTAIPGLSGLTTIAGGGGALLFRINQWLAALPYASQRCPTPSLLHVCGAILLLFAWCILGWRRVWIPCAAVVFSLLWLAGALDPLERLRPLACFVIPAREGRPGGISPNGLQLTFLDVGQGDSIVIRFPEGRVWVLDAGGIRDSVPDETQPPSFDTGEAIVSRYLWHHGIRRLDRLLLSHPHQDHAGGLPALMKNFAVAELDHGQSGQDAALARLLAVARELHVPARPVQAGEEYRVGAVQVQVLNPLRDGRIRSVNDNSIVLRLSYGRFSALLTGDLEATGESEVASRTPDLHTLLLKVAHHGSRSATQESFLNQAGPLWAVISAGRNNPFGHPSCDVLLRLIRRGVRTLLTADQGAITLETDGYHYSLSSHVSGFLESGTLQESPRVN